MLARRAWTPTIHGAVQQSELSLFSASFLRAFAPLDLELRACVRRLAGCGSRAALPFPVAELEAGLSCIAGELRTLLERVQAERASVFVFGPPKAGKSTLLAALAEAHAGEVSVLPSFPCVQRVRHGRQECAALARFDGRSETFPDLAGLRLALQRAHGELAGRAREVRAAGEAFDPARHLRSAPRRVERALPAAALERAALELVECPPVHGPLFPSYAAMWIGESDGARAAVFVVRAAQLFDDGAFDGLEELLAGFERVVLVLNLDERSRELSRAGELAPSPEREDPARLIEACERLTTVAPLAHAMRAGRVPVLAIDLLESARARLAGGEESLGSPGRARFADLLRELAGSLDAHESFRALAHGALRRGRELFEEARELGTLPGLAELAPRRAAADAERAALGRELAALARLAERERSLWEADELFSALRARLQRELEGRARALAAELAPSLAQAIEDWFASAASLGKLCDVLASRLEAARGELAHAAERALRAQLGDLRPPSPGATLSAAAAHDLEEARLAPEALLAPEPERLVARLEPLDLRALDVAAIPVRARLGERLTRRDPALLRRAVFGPPEAPARPIDSAEKAQRLGTEARAAMKRSAEERALARLGEDAHALARGLADALLASFLAQLARAVADARERLAEPLRALEARVTELGELIDALRALELACAGAETGLAELAERFERQGTLIPAARAQPPRTRAPRAREDEPALE